MSTRKTWVVRAGVGNTLIPILEARGIVAIGWSEMGDCAGLSTRDDFRERAREAYPDHPRVARQSGQAYRFVCEMEIGDLVLTPDSARREVLVGEIVGEYQHDPTVLVRDWPYRYAQVRAVRWLGRIARDDMSVDLRKSTHGQLTVFKIAGHDAEIERVLEWSSSVPHGPGMSPGDLPQDDVRTGHQGSPGSPGQTGSGDRPSPGARSRRRPTTGMLRMDNTHR